MGNKNDNDQLPYDPNPEEYQEIPQLKNDQMYRFERIHKPKKKSTQICICIAGYTSESSNFLQKWKAFKQCFDSSEIIALRWQSGNVANIAVQFAQTFFQKAIIEQKPLFDVGKELLTQASEAEDFKEKRQKAQVIGQQIGEHLIQALKNEKFNRKDKKEKHQNQDIFDVSVNFQKKEINFVSFSLGTEIVLYILKTICEKEKQNEINIKNIVLMGGASSLYDYQEMTQDQNNFVKGSIINCYSIYDQVLKAMNEYVQDLELTPIGLTEISGSNVINIDLSQYNYGHLDYEENHEKIVGLITPHLK